MFLVVLVGLLTPAAAHATYAYQAKWGGSGSSLFSDPTGIGVDSLDNLYVADFGHNQIQKFSPDGELLLSWGSGGSQDGQFSSPSDAAVDSAGNIYVADSGNDRIEKFDSSGGFLNKWGSHGNAVGEFDAPFSLATDSSSNVYVADQGNNRFQKFDSGGNFLGSFPSHGIGPNGIAVDPSGNVYVVNTISESIAKFDSSGAFLTSWGSFGTGDGQFDNPIGVAVDPQGTSVFVADSFNNRIQKFDSAGVFIESFPASAGSGNGQLQGPNEVAVGSLGMVFVSEAINNRIQRFGPPQASSTVRLSGTKVIFTAKPGATDNTVLATPATGTDIAFTDSGAVMPGAGCLQNGPTGATCHRPAYTSASLVLTLDGGNDSGSNGTGLPATIDGGAGDDTLTGGTSNDTLIGGPGTDTLTGGGGIDTADYSYSSSAVTVNLSLGGQQNVAAGDDDTISLVRNVTGSAQGDTLTGTGSANVIDGGAGNDTLIGGLGNDTLTGGAGTDTADYSTAPGAVTVDLSSSSAQNTQGAGVDTLSSLENLIGSAQGDTLTGSPAQNVVSGGGGDDTISVSDSSADTVTCGAGTDSVTFDALDSVAADCETQSNGNSGGSVGGGTPPPAGPDVSAPALSGLTAGKIKAGTPGAIAYKLSEPATVTFTLERLKIGRKVKKRCVRQTRRNRKRRQCTMYVKVATFTQAGGLGANALPIPAKVGGKPLAPGPYRITAIARDPSGNVTNAVKLTFAVLR